MRFKFIKYLFVFSSLSLFYQCKTNSIEEKQLQYILIKQRHYSLDTMSLKVINNEFKDSIFRLKYRKIYVKDILVDTKIYNYELPLNNSLTTFNKLNDTSLNRFRLIGKKFILYKKKSILFINTCLI